MTDCTPRFQSLYFRLFEVALKNDIATLPSSVKPPCQALFTMSAWSCQWNIWNQSKLSTLPVARVLALSRKPARRSGIQCIATTRNLQTPTFTFLGRHLVADDEGLGSEFLSIKPRPPASYCSTSPSIRVENALKKATAYLTQQERSPYYYFLFTQSSVPSLLSYLLLFRRNEP